MQEFDLVDLLDSGNLPLKNRIDQEGYYQPESLPETLLSPNELRTKERIPQEPLREGEQYRFHFDMTVCIGCQCCVVACNEQNNNPAGVHWRQVGEVEGGVFPDTKKYHMSMACNHCLDPSCLSGCPTDAYIKLENGIVKHREDECIGCGYCSWNCPYDVPQFNPERRIVTKCDMCHSRLAEGEMPACVASCPESAIQIEKVNVAEWRENHSGADGPHVPDSSLTVSTTRITVPDDLPDELLKGNRHAIQPEHPHTSLIFMTVLTQLATGGFLALWLGETFSKWTPFAQSVKNFLPFGATGMLAITGVALLAAVFHLGRPIHAYKALRMWRRSWLSREVLLFAIFSKVGGLYALLQMMNYFWKLKIPDGILYSLGALVVISGLAGVYASAKIYLVPARPAWNTKRTIVRFFLTGFILGPLFALVVYSFYSLSEHSPAVGADFFGITKAFILMTALSGAAQLTLLISRLLYLRNDQPDELYASSVLLTHRFKNVFVLRIVSLVLGCFVFPFSLYTLIGEGNLLPEQFICLSLLSFILAFMGEVIGRYLFFVTVVPKKNPGAFFTIKRSGH